MHHIRRLPWAAVEPGNPRPSWPILALARIRRKITTIRSTIFNDYPSYLHQKHSTVPWYLLQRECVLYIHCQGLLAHHRFTILEHQLCTTVVCRMDCSNIHHIHLQKALSIGAPAPHIHVTIHTTERLMRMAQNNMDPNLPTSWSTANSS